MDDFSGIYPVVRFHIDVSDREDKNLVREGIDISLRVGEGDWDSLKLWRFADEEIFPVCSPAYLENYGPIRSVADLPNHRLLQTDEPYRVRIAWKEWLNHNGVAATNLEYVLICTGPASLLQSVIQGQGVSLGWSFLVDRKLEEGQLVRPVDAVYRSGLGVYVVAPDIEDGFEGFFLLHGDLDTASEARGGVTLQLACSFAAGAERRGQRNSTSARERSSTTPKAKARTISAKIS